MGQISLMFYNFTMVLLMIAVFCAGYWYGSRHLFFWRAKWIELEQEFAKSQNRKPRDISTVENQPIKKENR